MRRLENALRTVGQLFLVLLLLAGGAVVTGVAAAGSEEAGRGSFGPAKIAPELRAQLAGADSGELVDAIVTLRGRADLSALPRSSRRARIRAVVRALQGEAEQTQGALRALVATRRSQGKVVRTRWLWIVNGLAVRATADVIRELAARPEVLRVDADATIEAPVIDSPSASAEANVALVNAPALWALGVRGQGIVVASMDTGVDLSHPDLSAQWRGGTNSWFDPNGEHPTEPTDRSGHGTWTMGVMVGRETGGTAIGVAPDAQWIAVKMFDDRGVATASRVHQGFQWLLDPDGDPGTPDAPNLVNNSWAFGSSGCDLEFEPDLQSLRAAGIVSVFAAGNYGPGVAMSASPANNPSALAVGATGNTDLIYASSSRGPSACGEPTAIFPELVAPGIGVRTTDLFGLYTQQSGTSLAAPHVTGALALLLDAYPGSTPTQLETALESGAVDLGAPGPDDDFGYGRLDILAAYDSMTPPPPPNGAPVVGAGPSMVVTLPAAASLDGTVTDDGLPSGVLTTLWTAQSGPGTVAFGNAASVDTTAAFSAPGTYVLRLTADDGALAAFDETTVAVNPAGLIFADGFESGDLSAWSGKLDAEGDLSVSAAAALVGARGMAALIDNTTAMYVRDESPTTERSYRASFRFDPNGITMAANDTHRILVARSAKAEVLRLEFRRSKAGTYQLSASVRVDGGSYVKTAWFTIGDAPHGVDVVWRAAAASGVHDGSLQLVLDGVTKQALGALDNDTLRVDQARLGPQQGIDARTRGTELFDEFVSRR
ncbi:MAG TPA: S8 family serine peptidase [Gaiellaceae bacterium]|jgi:subtilisin family serine protease